jgi:hypothetical protein
MRNLNELNEFRVKSEFVKKQLGSYGGSGAGAFQLKHLHVIVSTGKGWDHVSVSCENRTPSWEEMDYIKKLFFKDNETAMQLHVPVSDHINVHPFCLHLWRPHLKKIPRPPENMV